MIFDTHTHYDDEAFDADREELLGSFLSSGRYLLTGVGASMDGSIASINFAGKYSNMYAAVGLHPDYAADWGDAASKQLTELSANPKCVAIGEIGLDYYYEDPPRDIQKTAFEGQLALAKALHLPVIIHSRDAAKDTLDCIKASEIAEEGGIMHCFSYSPEVARECLDLGFHIGVGGALTFKNARKLPEVVEMCPLDRLVIETDCPYMAPVPFRGKRNDSSYLTYVCSRIADIKGISADEVERITYENALKVYRINH